jgi:hypothetical protein
MSEQQTTADEMREACRWAAGRDTGISSLAIMERMTGGMPDWNSWPRDPDDLGRCLRLLARIPGWRTRIGEMAGVSGVWAALTREWDALEASMRDEVGIAWEKGRRAPKTYAMMKRLEDAGLRADPCVKITSERDGRIGGYEWRRSRAA